MKKSRRRALLTLTLAFLALILFAGHAKAQRPDRECNTLMKQIDEQVDKAARVSERIGTVKQWIEHAQGSPETLEKNKHTVETDKSEGPAWH